MKLYLIIFFIKINLLHSYSQEKIAIFHFNDLHGNIDNLPRIKFIIDSISKYNDFSIILNGGDLFSGNPYVDKYIEPGYPIIEMLNHLPLSASTIGNHEFDFGINTLNERIYQADFKFIASNIFNKDSSLFNIEPYIILNTDNNKKIAIIGACQTDINNIPATHPSNVKGLEFKCGTTTIFEYSFLKDSADYIILLSHLGFYKDSLIAESINLPNLIVGGHNHIITKKPIIVNNTAIVQAGNNAKYIGFYNIELNNDSAKFIAYNLIEINTSLNIDSSMFNMLNTYKNSPYFYDTIAYFPKNITEINDLGKIFTDAYIYESGSDIAIQNIGGIRLNYIPAGPVLLKTIYELDPFNNDIVIVEVNIDDIKDIILSGYFKKNRNDFVASGFNYKEITDKKGKITDLEITFNNLPNKQGYYRLALSSYVFETYLNNIKKMKSTNTNIKSNNAIINYLKNNFNNKKY